MVVNSWGRIKSRLGKFVDSKLVPNTETNHLELQNRLESCILKVLFVLEFLRVSVIIRECFCGCLVYSLLFYCEKMLSYLTVIKIN